MDTVYGILFIIAACVLPLIGIIRHVSGNGDEDSKLLDNLVVFAQGMNYLLIGFLILILTLLGV